MGSCIFGCGWWHDLGPQIQQAIIGGVIGGFFTVLTATIGVLVVAYQLRRQARNAIAANAHSEAMKLKKDIYQTILATCEEADAARMEAATYVRGIPHTIKAATNPDAKKGATAFIEKVRGEMYLAAKANAKVMRLIEHWRIVEPRMNIFMLAFGVANGDLRSAERALDAACEAALNRSSSDESDGSEKLVMEATRGVEVALVERAQVIGDFLREMQNALLGELFGRALPVYSPASRKGPAIAFGKEEELYKYWNSENKTTVGIV
jgi:hypothetical protein